ncbi:unnamed protein product [Sphenostylis stenocarpa]|uniref:Glycosyltransferase n=1 Tax=Sphenostylis stenocarpa TaxID=92480 RepID=A0AA86TDJ8_9FABA|nr:unnamed protein product [Sphenostylis stenocarpa]
MASNNDAPTRVLMVSFPAQGHINPLLRLGKHLAAKGLSVTFSTTESIGKDIRAATSANNALHWRIGAGSLTFEFFEDGLSDDDPMRKNLLDYTVQLERVGRKVISHMIKKHAESNGLFSCIINNPFVPWVCDVATELGIPCALLWIQSVAVFTAYYHYFNKSLPFPTETDLYLDVPLPNVVLKHDEIPDFLHPFSPFPFLGKLILEQFKNLSKPFCILVDSFEELEFDCVKYLSKHLLVRPVGPLVKDPTHGNGVIRGDMVKVDDCMGWLSSKAPSSVVYISFGSVVYLPQEQIDEIARGLLMSKVSFLWVLKPPRRNLGLEPHVLPEGFLKQTSEGGKVVQWSPQEEVLAHPSVACFLTHCGWNSSMEALTFGVPVITFPAWGDQVTNAKFLVDVFGVGVRLGHRQAENKVVTGHEVENCLLKAMVGDTAEVLKRNALKWKDAADTATAHGGSSYRNLDAFVADIKTRSMGKFFC